MARALCGLVAAAIGWRGVYVAAAALNLVMALALYRSLPEMPRRERMPYPELIAGVFKAVVRIPAMPSIMAVRGAGKRPVHGALGRVGLDRRRGRRVRGVPGGACRLGALARRHEAAGRMKGTAAVHGFSRGSTGDKLAGKRLVASLTTGVA